MGTLTEATGSWKRLVATVVEGRNRTFAVSAFAPIDAPSLEADAMAILRSFRPLRDGASGGLEN